MSIMYEDIGFLRKAAFFTRMAALHCTSQHLPLQGWTAVSQLCLIMNTTFRFIFCFIDVYIYIYFICLVIQSAAKCVGGL